MQLMLHQRPLFVFSINSLKRDIFKEAFWVKAFLINKHTFLCFIFMFQIYVMINEAELI